MTFKTVQDIKSAVDNGQKVIHHNNAYRVIKDDLGQYLIYCTLNGFCIELTWRDGVTLNGKLEDFKIIKD